MLIIFVFSITIYCCTVFYIFKILHADMAELADAYGSGPYESNFMQVQVLLSAPNNRNPNLVPVGYGFGFLLYFSFNSKFEKHYRI